MSHRDLFLVCLLLVAPLHAGCELVADFDEDALQEGSTVDPVPVPEAGTAPRDAAVRTDAAVVQPEDASVLRDAAILTDAGPSMAPDGGLDAGLASDGGTPADAQVLDGAIPDAAALDAAPVPTNVPPPMPTIVPTPVPTTAPTPVPTPVVRDAV